MNFSNNSSAFSLEAVRLCKRLSDHQMIRIMRQRAGLPTAKRDLHKTLPVKLEIPGEAFFIYEAQRNFGVSEILKAFIDTDGKYCLFNDSYARDGSQLASQNYLTLYDLWHPHLVEYYQHDRANRLVNMGHYVRPHVYIIRFSV